MPLCGDRELTTPSYFAYVKIAEGCDNRCSYCAIPLIRGGYRSRTMESIEEECKGLVANGAKSWSSSPRTPPATASTCTGSTPWPSSWPACAASTACAGCGCSTATPTPSPTSCWTPWPGRRRLSLHRPPPPARLRPHPQGHEPPGRPAEPHRPDE